ncbi:uncharacterized protein LOC5509825 isoform X2 [Nematostella vectensis]|uniref:uncharacterized protein LOC5509825 isoform X1 n=1 Tax=Nematostella vectensis TaxID=45351 RepID=UPI0020770FA3|nr:uncharacterized protein LOC5509825 isoform X1 [Nematostella vectensis]XP_048587896.1 uncharacterized protein LOC5509825 isoform X2 [Nematostella vectensis]
MATKSTKVHAKLSDGERRSNGFCRYFVRGDCREKNECKFSHNLEDVPVCRYYLEDRCMFGAECWYRHPEQDIANVGPMAAILGAGLMCGVGTNMNLLLAAAVAGAATPTTPDDVNQEGEEEKEDISLEKVMEMWHQRRENASEDVDKNNIDKLEEESTEKDESTDTRDSACSHEEKEENLLEFSTELKRYSIASWSASDMHKFISTLAKLDIEEYDEYDIITSKILGDSIRSWQPEPSKTAELFMMITETSKTDLTALILTLCNAPDKVHDMERHIAAVVLAAQKRDPKLWSSVAVGKLLQRIEEYGFNVDAIEMFNSIGKDLQDAEKVGELVHDYLVATGEKNTFDCRCRTPECECPVVADEGVAFLMFSGLQRKLDWSGEDKIKFFKKATGCLWPPEILKELGDIFGIKDPLKVATPRVLKRNQKLLGMPEQEANIINTKKQKAKSHKCSGGGCPNQSKRDCDNAMCGKCCRKTGKSCDVHEDFSAYVPPEWDSGLGFKFHKVEPSVVFNTEQQFENLTALKKQIKRVEFGPDFSVTDDHVIKVVDLWSEHLVVLQLGSSDSGCGSQLTDAAPKYIADHCPNLRKLRLESATHVTDEGMCAVIDKCPLLEELHISGNDKISGNVSSKALKPLFESAVLPNLRQLCVYDQHRIEHDVVYRLRRRRPKLKIHAGETDSDSFAHSMMLSMMGMSYGDGFY